MTTKLTHKALKELAKSLGGIYFDGNIYAHQNRVHYLASVVNSWRQDETIKDAKRHCSEMSDLIDEVLTYGADAANYTQLAYSCGIYGNNGQLHEITYYKDEGGEYKPLRKIVLYC